MKDKLQNLIAQPNYYKLLKRDAALYSAVQAAPGVTMKEKTFNFLHDNPNHDCLHCGKETLLITITKGYRQFCNVTCQTEFNRDKHLASVLSKIDEWGFDYLGGYEHSHSKMHIRNPNCGHDFYVSSINLFTNRNYCPTCGASERVTKRNLFFARSKEDVESFKQYRHYVHKQTKIAYIANIDELNPKRLPIGLARNNIVCYHIDHIVPMAYCYDNGIDADLCASIENLQLLTWQDNITKKQKLTEKALALIKFWAK